MPATSTKKRPAAKPKNPFLAVGMSFAVPGAGQFYLGAPGRGAAYLAVALLMVGYVCFAVVALVLNGDPETAAERLMNGGGPAALVAGFGYPLVTIVAMIDAWLVAKQQA